MSNSEQLWFHELWYWKDTGGEWIRMTFDLLTCIYSSDRSDIWRNIHIDLFFIVYSFVFTKWLSKAFMMKMLAAERECESLYKQSISDVRCTDVLIESTSEYLACCGKHGIILAPLLPINGDAMWDASEITSYCCTFPWFFIQKMFLRFCGTDAFPSYDRNEAYATPETQTNILWCCLCFHRRIQMVQTFQRFRAKSIIPAASAQTQHLSVETTG